MFNVASPVGKEVEGSPVCPRLAGLEHGVPRPEHGVVDSLVIQCSSKSSINTVHLLFVSELAVDGPAAGDVGVVAAVPVIGLLVKYSALIGQYSAPMSNSTMSPSLMVWSLGAPA